LGGGVCGLGVGGAPPTPKPPIPNPQSPIPNPQVYYIKFYYFIEVLQLKLKKNK